MRKEIFYDSIKTIKERGQEGDFNDSEYINTPARYIKLISDEVVGMNALFQDKTGEIKNIWDSEFNDRKSMKNNEKIVSKLNDNIFWHMRDQADFPVLVSDNETPFPTNEITAIIGPDNDGVSDLWTMFPGPPAPPIENGFEEFWSTHYFANK